WEHGITPEQVLSILEKPFTVKKNRKRRRASQKIIGRDEHGQCIAVPIERTDESGTWRPVTAWPCKPSKWRELP
ncbi:MAG TPA: hypothetical protein VFI42_07140, partial [Thermomicrobiaceae bacterium]|nr:hypothetical protein [Thermomicrobiaceae bacterium]